MKTRYKCWAQHNGRVANYCHVPLAIRRVHITSTPQAIHLLALCGEVINIHLRTKKDRSRSSIFELEYLLSYRVYKRKLQIFMFKLTPVTSKIDQGHPSSNLTKTLLRYIHGISLGPMRLIFVKLSCLQAKIANFHV